MLSTFLRQRAVTGRYVARCSTAAHTATATATTDRPPRVAKDKSLPPQNIHNAISQIREQARARFVETVEVAVKLNVDPRKQAQNVKGIATLPRGLGKTIRVGAFCVGADIDLAKNAGADLAGAEDLIKIVQGGEIPFDRVVATPEIMTKLSRIGKVRL
jgi:large subunit ribosomal protein L1